MSFTATDSHAQGTHTWPTPPSLIKAIGPFDLDPCAAPVPRPWPTAGKHFVESDDGLKKDWFGRVWLNPPYGTFAEAWVERLIEHGSGIALVFARTDTKWMQAILRKMPIYLLAGRIKFFDHLGTESKSSAGCPSLLIPASDFDTGKILTSGLKGVLKQ